jgi:hypothetical protein
MMESLSRLEEINGEMKGVKALAEVTEEYFHQLEPNLRHMASRYRLQSDIHCMLYGKIVEVRDALEQVTDELYREYRGMTRKDVL